MWVSSLVGGVCAFLSAYLMLKGWSLIGDALSHSIVPGVAGAYMLGLPFDLGYSPQEKDAFSKSAYWPERGCDYWTNFYIILWVGSLYGFSLSHVSKYSNYNNGKYFSHHTI